MPKFSDQKRLKTLQEFTMQCPEGEVLSFIFLEYHKLDLVLLFHVNSLQENKFHLNR